MIRNFLPVAIVAFVLTQAISAQEKPGIKAEVRLLAFSNAIQQKEIFAQDPSAPPAAASIPTTIRTYLNHQFTPLSLTSRKIVFTMKAERESLTREGEVVGEVTLPEGGDSSILVFLPGKPGGKTMYQIMPIPDSKRAFPAGSFHITNISPLPIRLMLEDKNFDFKPGQTILIDKPPMRPEGQCSMKAYAFKDEKWFVVSTGLWPNPGEARGLMILFLDPASGNIQLQSFDDVPPRSPKQPATTTP